MKADEEQFKELPGHAQIGFQVLAKPPIRPPAQSPADFAEFAAWMGCVPHKICPTIA